MTWVLGLGPEPAGHLAVALKRHRQWASVQGIRLPAELGSLEDLAVEQVRTGHSGSTMAQLWQLAESRVMPPKLLTYETTASLLSVSLSTVKRLVAAGVMPSVSVGSAPRIRVADLDRYVEQLADSESERVDA